MSSFWSIWITVLTLGTLVLMYLILRMCLKNFAGVKEGDPTGHSYDGIEELNNPPPKWWSTFFFLTIIWGFGYLLLYPGLGNFQGLLGWKSSNQGVLNLAESKASAEQAKAAGKLVQYDREVAAADEKYGPIFQAYAAQSIETLATDEEALKVGQRLFLQNCSQCHGSDARGTTGFPDLTDDDWLYGGDPKTIKDSIMHGRKANGMMAWSAALGGEQGVKEVAAFVLSLSGRDVDVQAAKAGEAKFAMCAACHGSEGKGSAEMGIALGAPNLTDNIWLYGGSQRAVETSIANGRAGVMPAWQHILGEEKVHVISAYVYSLSQK
ncbi:cytochrome c oxidase cbb3-type subunit 3 [Colwellia chukchiensis]|uniref:Cbb3-type cytochrome c oxidase subunit n=1 Tax=Colwellia chukchiensis TaxID=641665 RepID=A0A1H7U6J3_9GAMM|nr:cytochrome-c oxidase, cbb3-type subunit III [Colwellia chukchiensis]SEL92326.1 cytochrome c oxidase cbb3-type subunit 3 [Colwellia chukchiensis]